MEIVSEGSLESISRPASTSKRSNSRSSVRSVASSVQHSLDILPPEEPSLDWSTNVKVEEDVVVTDITEDGSSDKEDLTDEVPLHTRAEHADSEVTNNLSSFSELACTEEATTTLLVQTEQSNEISVANNEEPRLTDLSIQDENPDQAESECSSTTGSCENDSRDPKIRKGMERIKKLDNILSEKVKREKEVKKQRRDQERLWREQLDNLEKNRDAGLGKPVDLGPAHMLALGAPNETEDKEDCVSEDSPPVTPLFATQPLVDEEEVPLRQRHQEENYFETSGNSGDIKGDDTSTSGSKNRASGSRNKTGHGETTEGEVKKNNRKNKKERKLKKKDFIKRNILLAADANNVVAMTEEEKKRLEEILSDIGDLVEEPVDKDSLILYGNGFVPSQEEVKQLADIDLRLQSLMPSDEYAALCERTEHDQQSFQSETPRSANSSFLSDEEIPTFGEMVLQEKKEVREMKQRLMAIEEQLQHFQNEDHDEGILSESLLRQLLDDNSRTTSQATTILDSITSSSMSCDITSSFDNSSVISSVPTPTAEQ